MFNVVELKFNAAEHKFNDVEHTFSDTKLSFHARRRFTYWGQYGIHSPWWSQGYSIGLLKRLIVFTFNYIWKGEASFTASILVPVFVKSVIYHKKIEWYLVITYNIPNFALDKSVINHKKIE